MINKLSLILSGIGAFLLLIIGVFLKGRSSGKQEVQEEVQIQHNRDVEDVANKRVEDVKHASEVKQDAIKHSDSTIDNELSDKWTRG